MLQLSQIDRSIPIQRSAPVTRSGFPFSEFIFNLPRNLMASGYRREREREIMEGIKRRWKGRWKAEVSR